MKEFDNIIGYESIKKELYEILAVLKEPERFQKLGAESPKGLLLYGDPGVGKTVLAEAFIKASGRKSYPVLQQTNSDDFLRDLASLFNTAKKNAPSIIFMDDMDKYASNGNDEKPFHVLQSLIDSLRGSGVFVIATANDLMPLPRSLIREGRFDKCLQIAIPNSEDAAALVRHFLKGRPCKDVNEDDVEAMSSFRSCAAIQAAINQSAIKAAYAGRSAITMDDVVASFLSSRASEGCSFANDEVKKEVAIHEAGHILLNEACLSGSVGFATILGGDRMEGYCRIRKDLRRRPYAILAALGGKAAVEMVLGRLASGTESDINQAKNLILDGLGNVATGGMGFVTYRDANLRVGPRIRDETADAATLDMERYLMKAKEMVVTNRDFLDEIASRLLKKGYLLASEIAAIEKVHPLNVEPIRGI
jgi:cell division protease FtsH